MGRVTVNGLDDFIKDIENMAKDMPEASKKMMNTIGQVVKDEVKIVTPVDTGELRNKTFFRTISPTEVIVFNNTSYAAAVEFGHRTRLGMGKKASRLYSKKGTRSKKYVQGQYFMKRGVNNAEKKIPAIVRAVVSKVIKK